jgi:hypothetical protein
MGFTEFYVSVNGHETDVIVSSTEAGTKYLRTKGDKYSTNNLLSLPECP